MYVASSSRMPRLSVASSAGTTISRLIRSTIFISQNRPYTRRDCLCSWLGRGRRLDEAVAPVVALVDDGDATVGLVPEHEERLVQQVQLDDRLGDRERLRVELLRLHDGELGLRLLLRDGLAVRVTVLARIVELV